MAADFAVAPFCAADVKQSIAIDLNTLLPVKERFNSNYLIRFPFDY